MNDLEHDGRSDTEADARSRYRPAEELRRDLLIWAIIALWFVAALVVMPRLPDQVPIHWNTAGEADGYGSRQVGALLLPAVAAALNLLFIGMPMLDRKRSNFPKFAHAYRTFRVAFVLLMLLMWIPGVAGPLGIDVPVDLTASLGLCGLLIVMGNFFPQLRRNETIGIRLPWTLASDDVWRRTHRASGYVWVAAGVASFGLCLLVPNASFAISMGALGVAAAFSVAHSFAIREPKASTPGLRAE